MCVYTQLHYQKQQSFFLHVLICVLVNSSVEKLRLTLKFETNFIYATHTTRFQL